MLSYTERPPLCHVARVAEYKSGFKKKKIAPHWDGFIFCLAKLRKADEHGVGQTNIRSLPNRSLVGNELVVLMPVIHSLYQKRSKVWVA
jgi:hypothetical protein